jgi:hypothetical protein
MKLVPVMLAIILAFLLALLFRGYSLRKQGYQITGLSRKTKRILTIALLVFLVGFLFRFMGRIALLIGAMIALIAFLSMKKD